MKAQTEDLVIEIMKKKVDLYRQIRENNQKISKMYQEIDDLDKLQKEVNRYIDKYSESIY